MSLFENGPKRRRRVLAASIFCAMALGAGPALADGRTELEKARAAFLARHWDEAEERLKALLDPKSGLKERPIISQARMYLGASLLAQGKTAEAKEVFEKLALEDPTFDPDPLSFPSDAINTFIDVRASLLEEIRKASQAAAKLEAERKRREEADKEAQRQWLEKLKAQAGEEKITVRHSRIVASMPFGVGQFQNGQASLGWVFLSAEAAALGGTAVTTLMFNYARNREKEELSQQDPARYDPTVVDKWHGRAEDIRLVNLAFVGGFVLLAAIGITQANVAFVSETAETKKRDLPRLQPTAAAPKITPILSALPGRDGLPGGAFVGLRGFAF